MKITASKVMVRLYKRNMCLALLFAIGFASACTPVQSCPNIQDGLAFLNDRYNPEIGLLNEAPVAAPNQYWLTNDNALAAYTLDQLDQTELADRIRASLKKYSYETNGQIEVVWGVPISLPPFTAQPALIATVESDNIRQEFHNSGNSMVDWAEYANLALLGVMNAKLQGKPADALSLYQDTLSMFDGTGFRDKAYQDRYETYKLAMALYTGRMIGAPNPAQEQMLAFLMAMQTREGGFITHYRDINTPDGDSNTETTSWALLALNATGCPD